MLNFLTTLGADSQFQKYRLILTKPNYEAPNEQAMKNILRSFAGQDQQTRSQIAFACIIKKIHNSPSKENWVYLLKNLIILDRVMSDNRFCQEIAQTVLHTISNYADKDSKSQAINAKKLLKGFWQIVQDICRQKISKKHILHYKRSERKGYLQGLSTGQIFNEIKILQKLFQNCISMIFLTSGISNNRQRCERQTQIINQKLNRHYNEFTGSALAEYLNIHFYSKLLTFFSCEYLCIHKFIQVILQTTKTEQHVLVSIEDAKLFKKMIYKFKGNCQDMKLLVERNKGRKGFENIDVKEFSAFSEQHIIQAIDQYIDQHSAVQKYELHSTLPILVNRKSIKQNFVDKKPLIFQRFAGTAQKTPRRYIENKKDSEHQNAFEDYFDSFSDEFPHKNMMTIDLIQDIRRDEQNLYKEILDSVELQSKKDRKAKAEKQQKLQQQEDFFKNFNKVKSSIKLKDILILAKDQQKEEEKQDSTSYSNMNSSRRGSLFDVLNIKWQTQKSEA